MMCVLVSAVQAVDVGAAGTPTKQAPSADDLLAIVSRMATVNKADSRKEFSEARQELSDKLFQLDRLKGANGASNTTRSLFFAALLSV